MFYIGLDERFSGKVEGGGTLWKPRNLQSSAHGRAGKEILIMNPNIVENLNVAREVAWLPWAVQYFFLIGLSYGARAGAAGIACRPGWDSVSRLALLGALVCGLSAPVALLADL